MIFVTVLGLVGGVRAGRPPRFADLRSLVNPFIVTKAAKFKVTNTPAHADDDARFYDRQQAYVPARGG